MSFRIPRNVHSFFYQTKFWPPIILLWILTFMTGYIGFRQSGTFSDDTDLLYTSLKLIVGWYPMFPVAEPPILNFARFFAFFLMFATLIVALETIFYESTRRRWCAYRGGHTIICGMGAIGRQFITRYLDSAEYRFIVIESDPQHPGIAALRKDGVHVLTGDATSPLVLEKAGVKRAKNLIAVTGSDTRNAIIAGVCERLRAGDPQEFICSVHIVNPLLCNLLQAKWYRKRLESRQNSQPGGQGCGVKPDPFNVFQLGGMLILEDFPPFGTRHHRNGIPHILVIGGGKLGEAIIQRLPHLWQISPEYQQGKQYEVTLIDRNASALVERYLELYPLLKQCCTIHPLNLEVGSAEFLELSFLTGQDHRCPFSIIYICLYQYDTGLYTALEIDEKFHAAQVGNRPDIIVRTHYGEGLRQLAGHTMTGPGARQTIRIFPLIDRVCSPEFTENGMLTEVLAHATHENYIRTCLDKGETVKERPRMVPFNELPEEYKRSNRDQVLSYSAVLELFGYAIQYRSRWDGDDPDIFSQDEIEKMAEIEHDRWWNEKRALGKPDNRNFRPYRELTEHEKDFDRNVFRNMHLVLSRVNMKVVRKDKFREPGEERD
jgi:hypothetical protein